MSKKDLHNTIYNSVINICEVVSGNDKTLAELLALKITKKVSIALLSEQKKLIYNNLDYNENPLTTKQIADKVSMSSKLVSTILCAMHKNTNLIEKFDKDNGKIKCWSRK